MTQDVAEPEQPTSGPCRHCGKTIKYDVERGDTLCPNCGRWQNTVQCPTCHQPVDVRVLSPDQIPAPDKEED